MDIEADASAVPQPQQHRPSPDRQATLIVLSRQYELIAVGHCGEKFAVVQYEESHEKIILVTVHTVTQ
jgi:hypothetical protein